MRKNSNKGFTLVELMIVVAIVGIISAIAYPSYFSYVRKSNRALAQSFLLNLANREEQYLVDSRAYATLAQLGVTVPSDVSKYYTVTATPVAGPPPTFSITAVPIAGTTQASDSACMTLSITNTGSKSATGSNPSSCW